MQGNYWHLRCAAIAGLMGLTVVLSAGTAPVSWQEEGVREAYPCESELGFLRLDFWVGAWDVYVQERKVGTNRIEKILHGCDLPPVIGPPSMLVHTPLQPGGAERNPAVTAGSLPGLAAGSPTRCAGELCYTPAAIPQSTPSLPARCKRSLHSETRLETSR